MFKHQGKNRTHKHNIQIATTLSFVAGIVNVTGYLSLHRMTTNVTGHFAYFIHDVANMDILGGLAFLLYIVSFLLGSFVSSLLIELISSKKKLNIYLYPTLLESFLLIFVYVVWQFSLITSLDFIACTLLFAMGVQNSFVTKISKAVVRTTHLTGLFTDLGIEISQVLVGKNEENMVMIKSNIKLRLYIISFFFLGGIVGGFVYHHLGFVSLLLGAAILITGLIYDNILFKLKNVKRKYRAAKTY